jgi:hypothetical protein
MLRGASIYVCSEDRPAIVSALHHNNAGILYEQEDPIIVAQWCDPIALATALRAALARFSLQDRNLRDSKLTDWPSYRASTARSVREFERTYIRIGVRSVNEAELFYDADAQPHGESHITLHVTLNRHGADHEMGKKLLRLFDACSDWQAERPIRKGRT